MKSLSGKLKQQIKLDADLHEIVEHLASGLYHIGGMKGEARIEEPASPPTEDAR